MWRHEKDDYVVEMSLDGLSIQEARKMKRKNGGTEKRVRSEGEVKRGVVISSLMLVERFMGFTV